MNLLAPKVKSRAFALLAFALAPVAAFAATINVNSSSTLATAVAAANPGDEIVLANGNYAGFTISRSGTAAAPIVIHAANQGSATINSGVILLDHVSYVTLQGLTITTSGGSRTVDGEPFNVAVWFDATDHCRLTRSTLHLIGHATATHFVMLGGHGDANRIDHNEFGPNTVHGAHYVWPRGNRTIPGVTVPSDRTSWANGNGPVNPNVPLHTQIDHNYMHDQAAGTAEAMVLGGLGTTGDYQDYGTIVEYNLLQNCDGDPEFISVKSSGNFIRYNTILTSGGMISLRAGNHSMVYNNFLLQGGKSGSGGIKIYEKDHTIFNNYIDNASEYPILVGRGDPYTSSSFGHAQVFRAKIVNNTVVNAGNRPVIIGHGGTAGTKPTDIVFANNIIQGTAGTLFTQNEAPAGSTPYISNIISAGSGLPSGFTVADPKLTTINGLRKLAAGSPAIDTANAAVANFVIEDMDGQARNKLDIGADEFSSDPIELAPLTTADVGPNSPSDEPVQVADPTFNPAPGVYSAPPAITISDATVGVSLRYTTDGSDPTPSTGILYTGPITTNGTITIKVIAFKNGAIPSHVVTAVYTIVPVTLVADPVFNPGAGTYAAGQPVTITTATSGASIHYTTNGSTPSSTVGTLYAGAITVNVTTTIKAIAFKSGSADSAVVSSTYTIPVPPPPVSVEAESLTRTPNGATATLQTDANTSGGKWVSLDGNSVGDFIDFTLPSVPAGTYTVAMSYKTNNNRGILSLKVDGIQVGTTLDQYGTPSTYPTKSFGTVTFATAGTHTLRLTVTGKNASSSSYVLSADKFTLTP